MRPPELWETPKLDKKARFEETSHPVGVRSSLRLNRTTDSAHSHGSSELNGHSRPSHSSGVVQESPRKRKRSSVAVPQPSPRRATRGSRERGVGHPRISRTSTTPTLMGVAASNGTSNKASGAVKKEEPSNLFSPSSMFLTSPINPDSGPFHNLGPLGHAGQTDHEVDIEALLAQFIDQNAGGHDATHNHGGIHEGAIGLGHGQGAGLDIGNIDLEALFGGSLDGEMGQELINPFSGAWQDSANGTSTGTGGNELGVGIEVDGGSDVGESGEAGR